MCIRDRYKDEVSKRIERNNSKYMRHTRIMRVPNWGLRNPMKIVRVILIKQQKTESKKFWSSPTGNEPRITKDYIQRG